MKNLSISNLRAFRDAQIEFCHPGQPDAPAIPGVTLLLGDNGAGKTSVLRAVALAALAPVIGSSGFRPYRLVRQTRKESPSAAVVRGRFVLHAQDVDSKDRKFSREVTAETRVVRRGDLEEINTASDNGGEWEAMFHEQSPAFLVLGYGAGRRVETGGSFDSSSRAKSRFVRYHRVAGLFEEQLTLTPLGAWLPEFRRTNAGRHKQVITLINKLLPGETRIVEEPRDGEYLFEHQGATVPFPAMSDGYRAYIGWIADLLYHVCMGAPKGYKLEENRGIVLVDEIDLHLHPAWQRVVVPQLASALPNLQFVLTSHSPLVAGTLQSGNLRLIDTDETGASVVRQLSEYVHGLTADQILVSSYFGLESPRAPEAVSELRALSMRAHPGNREVIDEFLAKLSGSTFSPEERATIEADDAVDPEELAGPRPGGKRRAAVAAAGKASAAGSGTQSEEEAPAASRSRSAGRKASPGARASKSPSESGAADKGSSSAGAPASSAAKSGSTGGGHGRSGAGGKGS